MADQFDLNAYFQSRYALPGTDKLEEVKAAAEQKAKDMDLYIQGAAVGQAQAEAQQAEDAQSWVGKLGLRPNNTPGELVNLAAGVTDTTITMGRQIVGMVPALNARILAGNVPDNVREAYTKYQRGEHTEEDLALLNAPMGDKSTSPNLSKYQAIARAKAEKTGTLESNMERMNKVQHALDFGQQVRDQMDYSSIVHRGKQRELIGDLKEGFQDNLSTFKAGWEKGDLSGVPNLASGLAGMISNIGAAAWKNPGAATEFVVSNLPQLAVAATGPLGAALSSIPYAMEEYSKGIAAYQKAHGGEVPPQDVMDKMALEASTLAMAEWAGDKVSLGVGKGLAKVLPGRLAGSAAGKVGMAGVTGGAGEFVTEGYQTAVENDLQGKPFSAEDTYVGGAIGAIAGGGTSTGLSGLQEAATAGAAKAQKVREAVEKDSLSHLPAAEVKALQDAAISSGDVSAFIDPEAPSYAPERAVTALYAHAADSTDPDTKDIKLGEANSIVKEFVAKVDAEVETLKGMDKASPEYQAKEREVNALRKQAEEAQVTLQTFFKERMAQIKVEDEANAILDADISTEADPAGEAAGVSPQVRADKIINLAMVAPERVDVNLAARLADSPNLSDDQRSYLRQFSETRAAENSLKSMSKVSAEVATGSDETKMVGIEQYRTRIGKAVSGGNQKEALYQLNQLNQFEASHQQKAALVQEAFNEFDGTTPIQVRKNVTNNEWEIARTELLKGQDARLNGAVTIHKKTPESLIQAIQSEAQALAAAKAEFTSAINMRFPGATNVTNTPPAQAVPVGNQPVPAATPAPQGAQAQTGKGTTGKATAAGTEVTQAPSGSSAEKTASTVEGQLQSNPNGTVSSEKVPEAPSSTESAVEEDIPALSAVAETSPEGTPYKKRKFGDFFRQKKNKDTDTSPRPLASIANFTSAVYAGKAKLVDYLPKGTTLDKDQKEVLKLFFRTVRAWNKPLRDSLVLKTKESDLDYRFNDLMQFLVKEGQDGRADLEENVKTALTYAGFSFVAGEATKGEYNTKAEVNGILNRDKKKKVSATEYDVLGKVGTRTNLVFNSLGQKAVAALGLEALKNVPKSEMPKLTAAMGAYVAKTLMEQGILELNTVSAETWGALTKDKKATYQQFLKLKFADGKLNTEAQDIYKASIGTGSVLDKLFGAEAGLREPTHTPVDYRQKSIRNSIMQVPAKLAKVMQKENHEASYVRDDMWALVRAVSSDALLDMAGREEGDTIHGANVASTRAKNEGIQREYQRFMDFVGKMEANGRLNDPLYFEHFVMKQQRVGITSNVINPQTSKVQRHLMYRKGWETTVKMTDLANFRLRVAEGLGVKADKQGNVKSLQDFNNLFDPAADPKAQARLDAVAELVKLLEGKDIDEKKIVAGVKAGGEKMHSLDALMAMAQHDLAVKQGRDSFTVQMMGEVDGVTNGPMLSNLLFGAAETAADLFGLLNRGGFFENGNPFSQYNLWRGSAGKLDLYERTALHMTQQIQKILADGQLAQKMLGKGAPKDPQQAMVRAGVLFNAIYHFTGQFSENGAVKKEGRNIVKTPLTAMVFGSTPANATDGMADGFIDNIYARIENIAGEKDAMKQDAMKKDLLDNLNLLLLQGKGATISNKSVEDLMKADVLSEAQIGALKAAFQQTVGQAVATVMKKDFAVFLERRETFNRTAKATFNLYAAARRGMIEAYIKEQIEKEKAAPGTGIAVGKTGVPIHDLTQAQEQELAKRLRKLQPTLHTLMSKESEIERNGETVQGQLGAGLRIGKAKKKLSQERIYSNEVRFGNEIPGTQPVWSPTKKQWIPQTSMTVHGYETREEDPGVGMAPISTHSLDSYISHTAAMMGEVLNVHDAHGAGLGNFEQTAKNLNQATWNAVLNYSPAQEMYEALARTVRGMETLLKDPETPQAVKDLVGEELAQLTGEYNQAMAAEGGMTVQTDDILMVLMRDAKQNAYNADKIKFEALAMMQAVDQYALEGGNYVVTDADRAAAVAKLSDLSPSMPKADQMAAKQVMKLIKAPVAPAVAETPAQEQFTVLADGFWGPVGTPQVASDPRLVEFFQNAKGLNAQQVMTFLAEHIKATNPSGAQFQLSLLRRLYKTVRADLPIHWVTPDSQPSISEGEIPLTAMGWYASNDRAIYVKSPDFVHSYVTAETLLHELTHAALVGAVQRAAQVRAEKNDPDYRNAELDLLDDLESLMEQARSFAHSKGSTEKFRYVFENLDEFLAYGMTNLAFQQEVLVPMQARADTIDGINSNKFVSGMRKLIDLITGYFFGTPTAQQTNGMSVFIAGVSGLFAYAEQTGAKPVSGKPAGPTNLAMSAAALNDYRTTDIFNALNNGTLPDVFANHLTTVLESIVEKLHGPFGSFKEALMKDQAISPLDVWLKAQRTGVAPFASRIAGSPLVTPDAVLFAAEQVEVTVKAALDSNEATAKVAYAELAKLYEQARKELTPADFGINGQAKYDFLFDITKDNGDKSDYLARFAALGITHPEVNALLAQRTLRVGKAAPQTFAERVQGWFENVLEFFTGKITQTYNGQKADDRLTKLVGQLVDIEAKNKRQVARSDFEEMITRPLEKVVGATTEAVKNKVNDIANSPRVKNSSNAFVRAGGALARVYVNDRVELFMEGMKQLRNEHFAASEGILMSLVTEFKGHKEAFQKLVRQATLQQGNRKDTITQASAALRAGFKDGDKMTKAAKAALSAVFMRTGAHNLLGTYSMAQIEQLVGYEAALEAEIRATENSLGAYRNLKDAVLEQARVLAYYKATGYVHGFLHMNAHNIARLLKTRFQRQVPASVARAAEPTIAKLVALYAIGYADGLHKLEAKKILEVENGRGDENGVEFLLKLHAKLEAESLDKLFKGNPTLMQHGYVPEIYNQHTEIAVADPVEGAELENQGYVPTHPVSLDQADPSYGEERRLYVLRNGGLQRRVTGGISLTDLKMKGSPKHNGNLDQNTWGGLQNASDQLDILTRAQAKQAARSKKSDWKAMAKREEANLAPVFNEAGEVANFRYLMAEYTKDTLLERNNDFAELMGVMAGSVYDKQTTPVQNKIAIEAIRADFNTGYRQHPKSFLEIGPNVADPELREIWTLLPEQTKKDVRDIWGYDGMMVRKDSVHILFGYRKRSLEEAFKKDPGARGSMEKLLVAMAEEVWGKKLAGLKVKQYERMWQEIVRELKDLIVVKTGTVLMGNIKSNVTLLWLRGVPMRAILNHHLVAFRGATAYIKDNDRLSRLKLTLSSGYIVGDVGEIEREIKVLEDRIARNPVKELVDAGLMPSIVEDIATEEDIYSYKSLLTRKVDDATSFLHPAVKSAARTVYMAHDTKLYQGLSRITQLSDFVARYTLYKHLTERQDNPLSKEDAVQQASEDFINYDIPMHPMLQYVDDMGIIPFMKYFLRIQKPLARIMKEHPGRVIAMLMAGNLVDIGETVLDSSILHKIGNNPIQGGALRYPGTLDELLTISGTLAVIK